MRKRKVKKRNRVFVLSFCLLCLLFFPLHYPLSLLHSVIFFPLAFPPCPPLLSFFSMSPSLQTHHSHLVLNKVIQQTSPAVSSVCHCCGCCCCYLGYCCCCCHPRLRLHHHNQSHWYGAYAFVWCMGVRVSARGVCECPYGVCKCEFACDLLKGWKYTTHKQTTYSEYT